jgi:protease-4
MGYVEREVIKQTNTRYYETEKGFMEQLLGDISTETATKLSLYLTSLR